MTIAVYHNGFLYTDSLNFFDTGSVPIFVFNEKVFKHPSGRWLFIAAGQSLSHDDYTLSLADDVHNNLISYYKDNEKNKNTALYNVLSLKEKNEDLWNLEILKKGLLITKENVWYNSDNEFPIAANRFIAIGAGSEIAVAHFILTKDAKLAIKAAAKWDFSCGGDIHTYKQSALKPFPKVI